MRWTKFASIFFIGFIIMGIVGLLSYSYFLDDSNISTNISDVTDEYNRDLIQENYYKTYKKDTIEKLNENTKKEIEENEKAEEFVTSSDMQFVFEYTNSKGEVKTVTKPVVMSMENMSISNIENTFDSWSVTDYNDENIYLEKKEEEYKYLIGIKDEYVAVYEKVDGNLHLVEKTTKHIDDLFDNDLTLLVNGIKVNDEATLYRILEDYES